MKKKIISIGVIILISSILNIETNLYQLIDEFPLEIKDLNSISNIEESEKEWVWCCNHSSHKGKNSACTNTEIKYTSREACYSKVKGHKEATGHTNSGCR